jgi:Carboxypeptidase regulatory-like domain/TonB dependent receptor
MEAKIRVQRAWRRTLVALLVSISAGALIAQTNTGAIRGKVTAASGPVAGVLVTATNVDSGVKYTAPTLADGSFLMTDVATGNYTVSTSGEAYAPGSGKVRVLVGQTATVDFSLSERGQATTATVTVSATEIHDYDLKTPEVRTNVTPEQIKYLPQNSRNFLTFAALAPGVEVTADFQEDPRYGGAMFRSGGQDARQVNVFIDGLSFKNDILKGGAFMQDSSRGNPFPQDAVSDFQILTQNYKAEYERAAAAIINVSTRSGGNDLHGDAFLTYQGRNMVAKTEFQDRTPDYHRYQWGASLSGPLIHDKLFGFGTYEQNDQARFKTVAFSNPPPADIADRFTSFQQGDVKSPFDEHLGFAKFTWQPSVGETGELTGNLRDESDRRDFGGNRAFTTGLDQKVKTYAVTGKLDSVIGSRFVNEATASYQQMKWTQGAIDTSDPHQIYFDIAEIGGRGTIQNVKQRTFSLRDTPTFILGSRGEHVAKAGVVVNWARYDYDNAQDTNPTFFFRREDNWLFPYSAHLGVGASDVQFSNRQLGVFLQDDWSVNSHLQVNVGIRWDYEWNMLNNYWVTPPSIVNAANTATGTDFSGNTVHLGDIINLNDYISTGSNRKSYKDAFQPRLGFSYDIFGNNSTVFTGAWGRYFDHMNLQDIYEEQHKFTWKYYDICFTDPGTTANPTCSNPVQWNPSYLSRQGLLDLIASGAVEGAQLWLLQNSTKPPRTDQWNVGLHQRLGPYLFGVSYNNVRGYNGLIWFPATTPDDSPANPDRFGHFIHAQGFGDILYSTYSRRTWYDAIFVTAERPFTLESNWGASITYTYANARQTGSENKIEDISYGFAFLHPEFLRKVRGNNDERHHVVASAIVGLPWEVRFSTLLTLGSGVPYTIFDYSHQDASIKWNGGNPPRKRNIFGLWAYESLDLRLAKDFVVAKGVRAGVQAEVFNVTNFKNFSGFEGYYQSANLGKPNSQYNTRRVQVGANLNF